MTRAQVIFPLMVEKIIENKREDRMKRGKKSRKTKTNKILI